MTDLDPRRERLYAELTKQGAKCAQCALYRCSPQRGPVLSEVKPNARLAILTDVPSRQDVITGIPMSGPEGGELEAGLNGGGLTRDDCSIINTISCQANVSGSMVDYLQDLHRHPIRLADGTTALDPITACSGRVRHDLAATNAKTVLAVGAFALESAANNLGLNYGKRKHFPGAPSVYSILDQHGSPVPVPGTDKILCSSLNPLYAMHGNRAYKYVIRGDISRAATIARTHTIDWTPVKKFNINPTFDELRRILTEWRIYNREVTIDIETDSIDALTCDVRCIGMGVSDPEEFVLVIPFVDNNGAAKWGPTQLQQIKEMLADVLDNNPSVYHNGNFDTMVLLRRGFMRDRDRQFDDTMILDHCTQANDLPHALGAVARRYFPVSVWKEDIDHKAAPVGLKWETLLLYNKEDVTVTMRLKPKLVEAVDNCSTFKAYSTDRALLPVARKMQELGLFIDEHIRGQLSVKLNTLCEDFSSSFQTTVGKAVNPRSSQQVGNWLYSDCKLTPPLNPKGKDWKEGEDWSTSSQALMRLVDEEADTPKDIAEGIESLLRFRACDKLRTTYTDRPKIAQDVPYSVCAGHPMGAVIPAVFSANGTELLPQRLSYSRMHSTYKLHVTPSGRWSSSPNCFDDQTEVLTEHGWLKIADYIETPRMLTFVRLAQYDIRSREITFDHPISAVVRDNVPEMVHISGPTINICTTPDHRLLFEDLESGVISQKPAQAWVDNLVPEHKFVTAGAFHGTFTLSDRELQLVRLFLQGKRFGKFIEHSSERSDYIDYVCALYDKFKFVYKRFFADGREIVRLNVADYSQYTQFVSQGTNGGRLHYSPQIYQVDKNTFERLLRLVAKRPAVYTSDGTETWRITSRRQRFLDVYQALAALHGARVSFSWRYGRVDVRIKRNATTLAPKRKVELIPYGRSVYCVKMPLDTLVTRRCGRTSIQHNCQNIPSRGFDDMNMRTMYVAPPDHLLVGADYQQVELRMYAMLANDQLLLNAFASGMDAHTLNAATLFDSKGTEASIMDLYNKFMKMKKGTDAEKVRLKGVRNIAKKFCFLEIYGGHVKKLFSVMAAERNRTTLEREFKNLKPGDCLIWHDRWHNSHPETQQWQMREMQKQRQTGYAVTFLDERKRHFPGGVERENAVPNLTIQGGSGDLVNHKTLEMADVIKFGEWSEFSGLVLQVHDYLGAYVPVSRKDEALHAFNTIMPRQIGVMNFAVDEPKATVSWADQ